MDIKERLQGYKFTKIRLEHLRLEIEKVKAEYEGINSALAAEGGKGTNKIANKTEQEAIKKLEVLQKLEREAAACEIEIKQIDNAMQLLSDREQSIIQLAYFENKSLYNISHVLEYAYRTVLRTHSAAIDKLNRIL